jgi:hypothetical protein
MKKIILILLTVFIRTIGFSQQDGGECLSGDCENGYGLWRTSNNCTYTGHFQNGRFDDTDGFIDYRNGYSYRGGFKDGDKEGYGVRQCGPLSAGEKKVEGYWKNGLLNGWGRITRESYIEEGNYVNHKRNGKILFIDTQYKYNGEYKKEYVWFVNGKKVEN